MPNHSKDHLHEAHLTNYRIAFDAMRAYHTSEIEHKKDMITILNSVFASTITVYAGIFYLILTPAYKPYHKIAFFIILMITALYNFLISRLKKSNVQKIVADNNRYEKFRVECQLERDYLMLNHYFETTAPSKDIYWKAKPDASGKREGSGNTKTISIIQIYCNMLISIVSLLGLASMFILINGMII